MTCLGKVKLLSILGESFIEGQLLLYLGVVAFSSWKYHHGVG